VIKNITTNKIVSENDYFASKFSEKTFGLIKYDLKTSLIMKTRFGIHTFGMKDAIDILILDNNKKIVKMKNSLKPNRIFFWNPKFDLVIELPKQTIKKSGCELGHKINF
jgi:uncharacterized protein